MVTMSVFELRQLKERIGIISYFPQQRTKTVYHQQNQKINSELFEQFLDRAFHGATEKRMESLQATQYNVHSVNQHQEAKKRYSDNTLWRYLSATRASLEHSSYEMSHDSPKMHFPDPWWITYNTKLPAYVLSLLYQREAGIVILWWYVYVSSFVGEFIHHYGTGVFGWFQA